MDTSELTALSAQLPGFVLVLARMTGFIVSAPILGGPYAPAQVKVLIGLALAVCAYPSAVSSGRIIPSDGAWVLLILQETAFGVALGWLVSLLSHGVRMGGELISRYAGFTAAENFDPDADIGSGPFADLMFIALVMLFFATDTHHHLIAALVGSYQAMPLGQAALGSPDALAAVTIGVQQSIVTACALAFPVLSVVMAITVVEGVLTRAVPQLNMLHISFTIKIVLSMVVTIAGLPAIIAFLHAVLAQMRAVMGGGIVAL